MPVRFGPFVLDPDTRELLRGGVPVSLSPKAFELLCLLVAHRPKAVAKSELQDRLWPDTFVVEKNLANLVGEIRDALGDDSSNPRFIRTVHRFGYAFRDVASGNATSRPASGRGGVSFLLKWEHGRERLTEGEHILGRDPDADVFLNQPGVSRRHARVVISAGHPTIEDLGSKNGTFVGDQRVEGVRALHDGEVVGIGSVKLTFSVLQAPHSTETEGPPEGGPY
jgi:DNA-binding winged helix-turn-helix (wHTH) protein